jgi:pyrroloquinoline-quinone synthase
MATIAERLDALLRRYDLLQHPFYTRWVKGELSREELADYAGQYAHVVEALPRWLEQTAELQRERAADLRAHAAEERSHVDMWRQFSDACGSREDAPNAATAELLREGDRLTELGLGDAVAWALEAQNPRVSAEKLDGLRKFYAIDADSGGQYFQIHQTLDEEHSAALRSAIAQTPEPAASQMTDAAATISARLWDLLSSVQRV